MSIEYYNRKNDFVYFKRKFRKLKTDKLEILKMITIICGEPGNGKTALMTYFAVQKMTEEGYDYWTSSCNRINELYTGGFNNLRYLPQFHTVYSDYVIKNEWLNVQSYYCDGFKVGLPNPFFDTMFFAPYSQIFLDEAQKYYDSRMSKYIRECVYRFYQLHRHNHLDIYMTCQRLGNIDLNIRDIARRIIYVEKLDITKDDFGRIIKLQWHTVEFSCLKYAEAYLDNNNKSVEFDKKTYEYEGNIFDYYGSYSNEPVFYDGNYERNYDSRLEDNYGVSVEDFSKFNAEHMYYAPKGYWKNDKEDKNILKERGYEV